MIAVIDYGAGNLRSVANTLDAIGVQYTMAHEPSALNEASKIILPGVGHFGQMMNALDVLNLRDPLVVRLRAGVPFLGICLGMQALFEGSEEAPETRGLGIFPGIALRFPGNLRVPHMGWNQINPRPDSKLFHAQDAEPWFYFAHSYYVPDSPVSAAQCNYHLTYTAALEQDNVFGVQFHPEKSAASGQALVKAFLEV